MDDRTADRLDIAETLYRYAEAIDLIGAHPVADGEEDPVLPRAIEILRTCLTEDGIDACCFTAFDGPDAADVKSYINTSTGWPMAATSTRRSNTTIGSFAATTGSGGSRHARSAFGAGG